MSRDWSTARSFGRNLQDLHLLGQATPGQVSGDDILPLLNVNTVTADSQPKKVTVSGLGRAVAPYVATASGSAGGPNAAIQFNSNSVLAGSSNVFYTGSGIYSSGVTSPSYTTDLNCINTVTATGYILQNTDNGRTVLFTNSSGIAVQVPSALTPGFNCTLIQTGVSGQITVTSGTGVTINSAYNAFKLTTRYSVAGVIGIASNSYIFTGDITV
jgi:hypothetical protein